MCCLWLTNNTVPPDVKVNDRYEFPDILDLDEFVDEDPDPADDEKEDEKEDMEEGKEDSKEGDDDAETKEGKEGKEGGAETRPLTEEERAARAEREELRRKGNRYHLHSVLVQSGDVGGGHYYVFVRPLPDCRTALRRNRSMNEEDLEVRCSAQLYIQFDDMFHTDL